jgi:hypothetical protein
VLLVDGEEHPAAHGIAYLACWRGARGLEVESRRTGR